MPTTREFNKEGASRRSRDGYISVSGMNHFRAESVKGFPEKEKWELTESDKRVMKSLSE
jgi:hypothetical protein